MKQQPLKPLHELLLELKELQEDYKIMSIELEKYKQQLKTAAELEKERRKMESIAFKIATYDGYFQYYFDVLKNFETQKEAFEHVNELHLKFFKKVRYSDWYSFVKVKNRWLKQ